MGQIGSMVTHGEQHGAENGYHADFCECGPVLQVGAFASAPDVYRGDHHDHSHADDGTGSWRERNDFRKVAGESACQRGDGAAGDYQEKTPAIKKRGGAAETITNVTVQSAGFRIGGGEFGVG